MLQSFALRALTVALIATSSVHAQDVKFSSDYQVELGKPYPVIDGLKRYYEVDDGIVCVKNEKARWYLQKLGSNGLSQTAMHQYEDLPKDAEFEHVAQIGERMYFFYSLWDKAKEREQLFAREIDKSSAEFLGKGTQVLSVQGKVSGTLVSGGFYRFHVTDKFDFILSADEETLVVQWARRRDKKDKAEGRPAELSVAVIDQDLTIEWQADLRLPYPADKLSIKDYTIDNKGDICIIANVYKGNAIKTKEREDADFHYEFLRCSGRGASWDVSPLSLSGRTLLSISFFEDGKGDLRAAGFYKKDKGQMGADGVFTCSFDPSDELTGLGFHEISKEIINMYISKKDVKRNEKNEDKGVDLGLTNIELASVLLGEDGSLIVVGEKRYTTVHCVTDSRGNTRCYTLWHADDLLVTSIDASDRLNWMTRLPKRMASGAPIGAGYKYMHGAGAHHFVHFGRSRDLDLGDPEPPSNKGDVLIVADRLDEGTGVAQRHAILSPDEVRGVKLYQLSMDRLTRTAGGEILMEAYKKQKEDVLVRITVQE